MLFALIGLAAGHANMVDPKPRNNMQPTAELPYVGPPNQIGCEGYACEWFSQGCNPGCTTCNGKNDDFNSANCDDPDPNFEPFIKANQTEYLTYLSDYKIEADDKWTMYSPWRSPGEAPVFDSCGVAAGSTYDNTHAGGFAPPPFKNGDKGSELAPTPYTHWTAGGQAQVSWTFIANHGGGYQYRLCPADRPLDEDCFKEMPLTYVNNTSVLWWSNGPKKDDQVSIEATRLIGRDGRVNNIWTKNPIPALNCPTGGAPPIFSSHQYNCTGYQFQPPIDDPLYWGFSSYNLTDHEQQRYIPFIKDFVNVPDVPEGHYVLSWRWDSEQTPQVWNSCSDIYISKSSISIQV